MSYDADSQYFRHRHAQETQRARHADEAAIRRLHLDLATRYAERAAEMEQLAHAAHD